LRHERLKSWIWRTSGSNMWTHICHWTSSQWRQLLGHGPNKWKSENMVSQNRWRPVI